VRTGANDATGALPGAIALDAAFTADRLTSTLADPPPAVHIASHFVFRPGPPSASYLLLGDGATLDLGTLGARRFDGIELLTLSACQTAVGSFAEGEPLDGFAALARRQGARAVLASLWPVVDDGTARLMAAFYARLAAGTSRAEALRGAQLEMLDDADENDDAVAARRAGRGQGGTTKAYPRYGEAEQRRHRRVRPSEPDWHRTPGHPGGSTPVAGLDRGLALPGSPAVGPRSSHPSVWAPFVLIGDPR